MIVNMLKAISKMLVAAGSDPASDLKVRVVCAREMLEEIIKGLEIKGRKSLIPLDPGELEVIKDEPPEPAPKIPAKIPKEEDTRPIIAVDKDHKLLPIKGLDMSAKVELDGKVMTHKEAIGRKFEKIRRID